MVTAILDTDYYKAAKLLSTVSDLEKLIAHAIAEERERCALVAFGQRCGRGTPWDLACTTIAAAIREG